MNKKSKINNKRKKYQNDCSFYLNIPTFFFQNAYFSDKNTDFFTSKCQILSSSNAILKRASLGQKNCITSPRKNTDLLWRIIKSIFSIFINLFPDFTIVLFTQAFFYFLNFLTDLFFFIEFILIKLL